MTRTPPKRRSVVVLIYVAPISYCIKQSAFEAEIEKDLALMGVVADQTSRTSDRFKEIWDYAIKMIEAGKAYTDDTEQAQVSDHPVPSTFFAENLVDA